MLFILLVILDIECSFCMFILNIANVDSKW